MSTLICRYLLLLILTALSVIFSYHFIDKSVVYFINQHHFNHYSLFYWMQKLPEIFNILLPLAYVVLLVRWSFGYGGYHDKFILSLIAALLITIVVVDELKFIFSRYWPDTFVENNLSLLQNNAYGFNWFHGGAGYRSFPSGHTATIFASMTVAWQFYPRLRPICALCCIMVLIGLTAMMYHFTSDMIAGACVGFIIGDIICRISFTKG